MPPLRILGVHGVGDHHTDTAWMGKWEAAIRDGLARWNPRAAKDAVVNFVLYDDVFKKAPLTAKGTAAAMAKLLGSGIWHGVGDLFRRGRARGSGVQESLRWTAGMVVQWAENEDLRAETRDRFLDHLIATKSDVVFAHSLGTLISYDALARYRNGFENVTYVTFGSQIGNPFVRSTLGGRIVAPPIRQWWHLYNRHDDVFTGEIRLPEAPEFAQVATPFDIDGFADHDAIEYLTHGETVARVFGSLSGSTAHRSLARADKAFAEVAKKPVRRALLVGINEYPNPNDRLEGCVNDCFLVSSLLQECGFQAEDIRLVLDDRATAKGIRERLAWLLDGSKAGDERVFYYSGHGAQVANRGVNDAADREDECLVPYDFDWTPDNAILDDEIEALYSQLPYDVRFVMMLDCCHSGGMARDGGPKARGISPPDDVRHRRLKWIQKEQMWVPRDFEVPVRSLVGKEEYAGSKGTMRRIGRALSLRTEDAEYDVVRREFGHFGPYLPLILQACQESELAYEYRHGVISHGAFTYAVGLVLRERRAADRNITFTALVKQVAAKLKRLGYEQRPTLVGPGKITRANVPW